MIKDKLPPAYQSLVLATLFTLPSHGAVQALDFSNGSSTLNDGGVGSIIYTSIVTGVDLIVTADSNYQAFDAGNNGTTNGDDYQIHLDGNTPRTVFTFSFVDSATQTTPQPLDFYFSVLDLDVGAEVVTLLSSATYTVRSDHNLSSIDTSVTGEVSFSGKTGGQVTNPTNSDNLTNGQEKVAINFEFVNTSSFQLAMSTAGSSGGRNFFGDSHDNSVFDGGSTVTDTLVVPEPSGVILLTVASSLLAFRRKR